MHQCQSGVLIVGGRLELHDTIFRMTLRYLKELIIVLLHLHVTDGT